MSAPSDEAIKAAQRARIEDLLTDGGREPLEGAESAEAEPEAIEQHAPPRPHTAIERPELLPSEFEDARAAWRLCRLGKPIPTQYRDAATKLALYMVACAYGHDTPVGARPAFLHPQGEREGHPGVLGANVDWTSEDFGAWVRTSTRKPREKATGPFISPGHTRIADQPGQRQEDHCASIGWLFLDADGVGDWHDVGATLGGHGAARVFWRSSGHCPLKADGTPGCEDHREGACKWHLALPLHSAWTPATTLTKDGRTKTTDSARARWKGQLYPAARFALHVLGQLSSKGFDPPLSQMLARFYSGAPTPQHAKVSRDMIAQPGLGFDIEACWGALIDLGIEEPEKQREEAERHALSVTDEKSRWTATTNAAGVSTDSDPPSVHAFAAAGLYIGQRRDGKHDVLCPWAETHSDGKPGAILFPNGVFHCSHTHPEGKGKGGTMAAVKALPVEAQRAHQTAMRALGPSARSTSVPSAVSAAPAPALPTLDESRALIAALPARAKAEGAARVALSPATLSAALVLHKHDPAEYAQLKITLKTLKVPAADWKAAMERAQVATRAQSVQMRHAPGVASAAPGAEPPPPSDPSSPNEPESDGPPAPFERGDADELARTLLDDMRRSASSPIGVIYDRGAYWTYMPHGLWTPATTDPHNIVSGYAGREVQDDRGKGTKALKLANGAIEGAVKNASRLAAQPDFFANAVPGIMFRNGILVVRKTGETCQGREVQRIVLEQPTPAHRAIHMIDCDYDPEAPAPKWSPALRAMFTPPMPNEDIPNAETEPEAFAEYERAREQDAEDCAQLLHAFLGISLLGKSTEYAKCLVLVGDGSNGKSTVIDVLSALAPASSICALPPHQWANHFHLAGLLHKRLNMVNELPAKDLMEAETFKAVIAGNSTTVSFKHRDPFDFKPRAGHVFAANRLPGTSDQSEGFWRRFMVLCFDRKFQGKEIIYNLGEQIIAEELDGVVARCIAAAQQVLDEGGFKLPSSSVRMMDEWRERSDQVRQFIKARCRELDSAFDPSAASLDTLYAAYTPWAQRNGFTRMNSANFGERLRTLGFFKRTKIARLYRLAVLTEEDTGVGAPGDAGGDANSTSAGSSGTAVGWTPPRKRFLS